jgi:pyruvate carboxylase
VDDTPELYSLVTSQNRAQKLLGYLGDLAVNGSSIMGQQGEPQLREEIAIPPIPNPANIEETLDTSKPCLTGWRAIIVEKGPAAFAKAVRDYPGCLIMDTTWRDAHQSLFATRLRTVDILNIAKETSHALANAYSLECWGGATFDVALRFLYEDPWERLRAMRKLVPNIPFQALVRGANAVGYTSYPDNAIYEFSKKAVENGLDICKSSRRSEAAPTGCSPRFRFAQLLREHEARYRCREASGRCRRRRYVLLRRRWRPQEDQVHPAVLPRLCRAAGQ